MQKSDLLTNLEELSNSLQVVEPDFEWIKKYCDYTIENNKMLICTNSYKKTFKIFSLFKDSFKRQDSGRLQLIQIFSTTPYDFIFLDLYVQVQIDDINFVITDNIITPKRHTFTREKGHRYELNIEIYKSRIPVRLDQLGSEFNHSKYVSDIFDFYVNYFKKYVTGFTQIIEDKNIFRMTAIFNDKFTALIDAKIINIGYDSTFTTYNSIHDNVISLIEALEGVNDTKLEKDIYNASQPLIELIKQRDTNNKIKDYYKNMCEKKNKHNELMKECMKELKKRQTTDYNNLLSRIHYGTLKKLVNIWTFDSFNELKKQCTLTDFEIDLAKHLYSLNKNEREKTLLKYGIYL